MEPRRVEALLRVACLAELDALKPGNVHRLAEGHGMTVADYETSAALVAAALSRPDRSVGEMIRTAVEATMAEVGCNTNLGIVLLCAPLARAALLGDGPSLRQRLLAQLDALSLDDSRQAFAAIAQANPAGLGKSASEDVHETPTKPLQAAMASAQDRDRIALQYATGYAEVLDRGVPAIRTGQARWASLPWALTWTFLGFLATAPDSHILRKHGAEVAETVRRQAVDWERRLREAEDPAASTEGLLDFDRHLKEQGINPGTCADLTVASCFAHDLDLALATPTDG